MHNYVDKLSEIFKRRGYLTTDPRVPAEKTVDAFETWFADSSEGPRFGYLHFMDTHMPFDPPDSQWERSDLEAVSSGRAYTLYRRMKSSDDLSDEEISDLRRLYEAEAEYVDTQLERLVDILKSEGEWDSSLVVFTSDHGELFGERESPDGKRLDHPRYLCEEITHVPLVIAGGSVSSYSYESLVSGMDLAPTIVEAFDIKQPDSWRGQSLDRVDASSPDESERQPVAEEKGNYVVSTVASPPGFVSEVDPEWLHVSVRSKQRALLWWRNEVPTEYYRREVSGEIREDNPDPADYHAEMSVVESYDEFDIDPEPRSEPEEGAAEQRLKDLGYLS
jgi:hypothetical protein